MQQVVILTEVICHPPLAVERKTFLLLLLFVLSENVELISH